MTLINVGSITLFKLLFLVWLEISYLYLFHLIVLLNPVFYGSNNLFSSWVDKVTTGTCSFVSVIFYVAFVGLLSPTTTGLASVLASLYILCLYNTICRPC